MILVLDLSPNHLTNAAYLDSLLLAQDGLPCWISDLRFVTLPRQSVLVPTDLPTVGLTMEGVVETRKAVSGACEKWLGGATDGLASRLPLIQGHRERNKEGNFMKTALKLQPEIVQIGFEYDFSHEVGQNNVIGTLLFFSHEKNALEQVQDLFGRKNHFHLPYFNFAVERPRYGPNGQIPNVDCSRFNFASNGKFRTEVQLPKTNKLSLSSTAPVEKVLAERVCDDLHLKLKNLREPPRPSSPQDTIFRHDSIELPASDRLLKHIWED
ncbi:hypothetical protein C8R44DRAFT_953387 [Mycena epipterygia]|nr:hypothetical protein C8R44DRAFT_953387 [Mycena epipterygia]